MSDADYCPLTSVAVYFRFLSASISKTTKESTYYFAFNSSLPHATTVWITHMLLLANIASVGVVTQLKCQLLSYGQFTTVALQAYCQWDMYFLCGFLA